jgi:hypothetical protein
MMDNVKERLGITNEDEWKVIQGLVQKVMDARREVGGGGFGGFGRRGRGDGGGGNNAGGRRGAFGPVTLPEAEALQQALDAKAPTEEVKAKLVKFRDARKEKEAALAKAQEDLRKVLTVRQEAAATLMGLLP